MLGELKIEPISVEGNCICFIDTGLNEEKVRAQFLSRGHKFSISENFPSIRDFTSTMRLHFRSDLVGACLPQTLLIIRALRHEWNGVSCLHNFTEELSNRQEVQ